MKKNLIALAVAAATTTPFVVNAATPTISGFADVNYTLIDDTRENPVTDINDKENQFAADGEIDFAGNLASNVRVQADIDLSTTTGSFDSAEIEQAFFETDIADNITMIGGVFNNPIGWEAEDRPNMYQTSHNFSYDILNSQTALRGNNVTGVGVTGKFNNTVSVTAAVLNDIQEVPEENSIAVAVGFNPMPELAIEIGFITQDNDSGYCTNFVSYSVNNCGMGSIIDANVSYKLPNGMTVAGELLTASELVDYSAMAMLNMPIPETSMSVTLRGESLSLDGDDNDTTALTLAGVYTMNKALSFATEAKYIDGDFNDGDMQIGLEAIASF
jgi:hypothetical protein